MSENMTLAKITILNVDSILKSEFRFSPEKDFIEEIEKQLAECEHIIREHDESRSIINCEISYSDSTGRRGEITAINKNGDLPDEFYKYTEHLEFDAVYQSLR